MCISAPIRLNMASCLLRSSFHFECSVHVENILPYYEGHTVNPVKEVVTVLRTNCTAFVNTVLSWKNKNCTVLYNIT